MGGRRPLPWITHLRGQRRPPNVETDQNPALAQCQAWHRHREGFLGEAFTREFRVLKLARPPRNDLENSTLELTVLTGSSGKPRVIRVYFLHNLRSNRSVVFKAGSPGFKLSVFKAKPQATSGPKTAIDRTAEQHVRGKAIRPLWFLHDKPYFDNGPLKSVHPFVLDSPPCQAVLNNSKSRSLGFSDTGLEVSPSGKLWCKFGRGQPETHEVFSRHGSIGALIIRIRTRFWGYFIL